MGHSWIEFRDMTVGEFLTGFVIIALGVLTLLGIILGASYGAGLLFFLTITLILLITHAFFARVYNWLRTGSFSPGKEGNQYHDRVEK